MPDDDLLDIAQGDPRRARRLRDMLTQLADGDNETLREMARTALDGTPLRDVARSGAYADEIGHAFGTFWRKYEAMSPDEREELQELGRQALDDAAT